MLAAVDVSDGADLKVAREVVTAARRVAPGPLHLVHAWHLVGESVLACAVRGVGHARMGKLRQATRAERRQRMKALLVEAGIEPDDVVLHVVHGRPGRAIRGVAGRVGAGWVVLGPPSPVLPGLPPLGVAEVLAGRAPFGVVVVPREVVPSGGRSPTGDATG